MSEESKKSHIQKAYDRAQEIKLWIKSKTNEELEEYLDSDTKEEDFKEYCSRYSLLEGPPGSMDDFNKITDDFKKIVYLRRLKITNLKIKKLGNPTERFNGKRLNSLPMDDLAAHYVFNDNWGDLTTSSNKCFRIVDGKMVKEEDDKRSDLDHVLESVKERQEELQKSLVERKKQILYVNKSCESGGCDELNAIVSQYSSIDPEEFWLKAIGKRCVCFKPISYLWNERYGMHCQLLIINNWDEESTNMSAKRTVIKKMVKCLEKLNETRNKNKA